MPNLIFGLSRPKAKFFLGQIMIAPNVLNAIPKDDVLDALSRHIRGDWGIQDVSTSDANERALEHGGCLFSMHYSTRGLKFQIITESGRSVTIIVLAE